MSVNNLTFKQFRGMAYDTLWRRAELDEPKFHAFDWRKEWESGATVLQALDKYRKKRRSVKHRHAPEPYVLMQLNSDGSIIGYLVSTASGRRAIHATRHGAITFDTYAKAYAYNANEQGGKLTPVRVADLPDPSGPNVLRKNPKPFGKRKASHKAFPKKAGVRKPTPKFGRKKNAVAKKANEFVVRAMTGDNKKFYFNGVSFEDRLSSAARFANHRLAERLINSVEDSLPSAIKHLDIIEA